MDFKNFDLSLDYDNNLTNIQVKAIKKEWDVVDKENTGKLSFKKAYNRKDE